MRPTGDVIGTIAAMLEPGGAAQQATDRGVVAQPEGCEKAPSEETTKPVLVNPDHARQLKPSLV
jgi:hypothetical protein